MARKAARVIPALLFGLLLALVVLAAAEGAARLAWGPPAAPDPLPRGYDYIVRQSRGDYFRPERAPDGSRRYVPRRARSTGAGFAAVKAPGTLRVFVIGGSVAIGFSDEAAARLGEYLRRALPGRGIELVGCGMGGYSSRHDLAMGAEALRHQADLLVVLSGHNETGPLDPPRPAVLDAHRAMLRLRLYSAAARAYARLRPPRASTRPERDRRFAENLRALLRLAGARGVPVALCTLGANLRDIPPAWEPAAPDPGYVDARLALERGEAARARAALGAYARARPKDPVGHYWLGRALDAERSPAAARRAYAAALDAEERPDRCPPARNALIRALAAEHGAALVDLEKAFAALVPDGVADGRVFEDGVHWFGEAYPVVSLEIVSALRARAAAGGGTAFGAGADWDVGWLPAERARAAGRLLTRRMEPPDVEGAFFRALFSIYNGWREPAVAFFELAERRRAGAVSRMLAGPGELQAVLDRNIWTSHMDGWVLARRPAILALAAEALRRRGRAAEAAARLEESLRLSPGDPDARLSRALTDLALGRAARARAELADLAAGGPERARAWAAGALRAAR